MTTKTKNNLLMLLVVALASIIPALILSKWIEAFVFLTAHTLIRPQFPREYHNIIPKICRTITGNVLFFGISFILPFEYSLLSAVPINYAIGWVGFTKATSDYYLKKCIRLQEEMLIIENKLSDPKTVLLNTCRERKLSARDTEIALMYYYERKTPKDIWLWLCSHKEYEPIEWESVYQLLWRIGKKLK